MKHSIIANFWTSTDVDVSVESSDEGILVTTVDGPFINHFTITAEDAHEISLMLQKASDHTVSLNRR